MKANKRFNSKLVAVDLRIHGHLAESRRLGRRRRARTRERPSAESSRLSKIYSHTGTDNTIQGNLRIESGAGDQTINLAVNSDMTVNGSNVINLRQGTDIVDNGTNGLNVDGFLIFRGVNTYENKGTVNLGSFLSNTRFFDEPAFFDNDGTFNIVNNLSYLGGVNRDSVFLNDGMTIGGNAFIDLGENTNTGSQTANLTGGFTAGGNIIVVGGQSTEGNNYLTSDSTTIGGFFVVDFSANTNGNSAVIAGNYTDDFGYYVGSDGEDSVTTTLNAGDMDLFMELRGDDDVLNLSSVVELNSIY